MGEIKYNGRTYSGLIQANGCFVDTSNVLLSATAFVGSYSYTATEDCFVCFYISPRVNDDTFIQIDGENVETWWRSSVITDTASFYVRKGQTISVPNAHASNNSYIWVYGLLQGSPITFLSEYASACYDTNEREVGCWVDGKPLYQKTLIYTVTSPINSNTVLGSISDIDKVASIEGIAHYEGYGRGWLLPLSMSGYSSNISYNNGDIILNITNDTYGVDWVFYVTVQYTKTTDTAGSGKLTPTGFETHHYSTNEQIVGTWVDGKPLYERSFVKTLSGSPDVNGDSFLVASGISDIDTLVKIDGTVKENNNYAFFGYSGIADANSGWRYSFHLNPDSQLVVWTSNNSQCWIHVANGKAVCTIRYTKTTD